MAVPPLATSVLLLSLEYYSTHGRKQLRMVLRVRVLLLLLLLLVVEPMAVTRSAAGSASSPAGRHNRTMAAQQQTLCSAVWPYLAPGWLATRRLDSSSSFLGSLRAPTKSDDERSVRSSQPPAQLNSVFVAFELASSFSQADWHDEFKLMRSLGITTLTVAHVANGRPWNGTDRCFKFRPHYGRYTAFYPTKLDCFGTSSEYSSGLRPLLEAAANLSMGVYLGLANVVSKPGVGHFIESSNLDPSDRFNESWSDFARIQLDVFDELWALYSGYSAVIRGVYTVLEGGNCAPLYVDPQYARFLRVLSNGIRQRAPKLQVFASPGFGSSNRWRSKICNETLSPSDWQTYWTDTFRQAPALSFIAAQDGRGIYNDESTALKYLDAIRRAHQATGRTYSVNLEAFNFSAAALAPKFPGTCANRMPTMWGRFRAQLQAEASMVPPGGMTTAWEWFTCFSPRPDYCAKPPSGSVELGASHQALARQLREDYQAYVH